MIKIMKSCGVAVVVGVLSIASVPAFAQYNPEGNAAAMGAERNGKSSKFDNQFLIRPDRDTPQQFAAYSNMIDYGRCAAHVATTKLKTAMLQKANSATERQMWRDASTLSQSCRGSVFRPIMSLQRGVYSEGMYHAAVTGSSLPYGPLRDSDPGYEKFMAAEREHNGELDANDQVMAGATNCLVAQQPAVADAALAARHGSPEEAKALDALFAMVPGCAGAKRPTNLSRAYLRAFLASSAYRYAMFRMPAIATATATK